MQSRLFTPRGKALACAVAVGLPAMALFGGVNLTTFTNGQVADADQINTNFSELATAIENINTVEVMSESNLHWAQISATGGVTAQSSPAWVDSVVYVDPGNYDVQFVNGFFSSAPMLFAQAYLQGGVFMSINANGVSTVFAGVQGRHYDGTTRNVPFSLMALSGQGTNIGDLGGSGPPPEIAATGDLVGAGSNGDWITSSDNGRNWSFLQNVSPSVRSFAQSDSEVLAMTSSGVFRSTDKGVTWGSHIPFGTSVWYDIAYGNGLFVTVGNGGKAAYSSDGGLSWTEVSTPQSNNFFIAFGAGVFVACGGDSANQISVSTNGASWTSHAFATATSPQRDIIYGDGKFVMTTQHNTEGPTFTSTDGVTWTPRSSTKGPSGTQPTIAYGGNGNFAFIDATGSIQFSTDSGVTWSAASVQPGAAISKLHYANGEFIAGHSNHGIIAYSSTGDSWTTLSDHGLGGIATIYHFQD